MLGGSGGRCGSKGNWCLASSSPPPFAASRTLMASSLKYARRRFSGHSFSIEALSTVAGSCAVVSEVDSSGSRLIVPAKTSVASSISLRTNETGGRTISVAWVMSGRGVSGLSGSSANSSHTTRCSLVSANVSNNSSSAMSVFTYTTNPMSREMTRVTKVLNRLWGVSAPERPG